MDFTDGKLKCGDKVHFTHDRNYFLNGMIKSIPKEGNSVFVVYNCAEDWDNYENYTAALTNIKNLKSGWK